MTLRTPPSWLQNGSHTAENDRLSMQSIYATTGIVGATSLAATQNGTPNMTVNLASGWAAVVGTTQANMGVYVGYNDAPLSAAITVSPVANSRIDLVCLTVNDAFYAGVLNNLVLNVVAGVVAASPVVPATPANSIALAQVLVGTAVSSIVTANITDVRVNATTNLPVVTLTGVQTLTNKTLTSPTIATPVITGAVTDAVVADSADGYGFVGTPQVSTAVDLAIIASHMGKDIYVTVTAKTVTIPANATIAIQIGSGFTVTNDTGVTTSIAITTDTLILANSTSTGTRTLAPYGVAIFKKIAATKWIASGNGLT
jgi:hypothetical protein